MAPQYSLYVLQKRCDRRNSYWIANHYETLLISEVKRANNRPLRGMGGRAETTAKRSARTSSKWTFIHRYCGMEAGGGETGEERVGGKWRKGTSRGREVVWCWALGVVAADRAWGLSGMSGLPLTSRASACLWLPASPTEMRS